MFPHGLEHCALWSKANYPGGLWFYINICPPGLKTRRSRIGGLIGCKTFMRPD